MPTNTGHAFAARLENVSYVYPNGTKALDNVSIKIDKGDFVCLVGANGSGKSTLAKLFASLIVPTSGTAEYFGRIAMNAASLFETRSHIGFVFQNPDDQLVSSLVEDDIAFGPENIGIENPELRARVDDALSKVRMSEYARSNVDSLSGGQKQRVAIASALAMKPDLLVLDEPCAMLDSRASHEVMQVINEANEAGCTIIMITHRMDETLSAKRIVALSKGEIATDAPPLQFFENSELIERLRISKPHLIELCSALVEHDVPVSATQSKNDLEDELCRLLSTK